MKNVFLVHVYSIVNTIMCNFKSYKKYTEKVSYSKTAIKNPILVLCSSERSPRVNVLD